jgi:RNA polymerase sigma factor (sigma-70 family)
MAVADSSESGCRARDDEWLVVRCQLGERPAFDELIDRWHDPLWRYVRRMTGDPHAAQDIVQDLWLRVLRGIPRLREGAKLRPWLFGIARRAVMDRWRDTYAAPDFSDLDVADVPFEDPAGDREADLAAMELELTQLPFVEREVLTLFYLRELSLADVSDVLTVPIGTVKSRLFRARQLLRRQLESKGRNS